MKIIYRLCFIAFALTSTLKASAQVDTTKPLKVAIFAPLYIDDAFNGSTYTLGKSNLPKNILPGLEFYNGVMMAVDSLSHEGINMEISVYDTKQSSRSLAQILADPELSNTGLLIAAITNTFELKQFSQLSATKNIPLISATYPNTIGVTANPYFVLLNSSFSTHLQGLYKYMQQFYLRSNIIALRQTGTTEDFIKNYFTALNKINRSAILNIRWIDLKEGFTPDELARNLDSTKNNIIFVASPAENFGLKVVKALSSKMNYRSTAIGMPTWDRMSELNGPDCKNVELVFSSPFIYSSNNPVLSSAIVKKYQSTYYSRPSDMVYKGFETTYHFSKLLAKYKNNLINNLSDTDFTLFNQFDIQPIKTSKNNDKPDYLENKKLYFIKKQSGNLKSVI
jgi:ABC-type branched-subunit amino acid transport system substrate-binding protein